ncbi:hypothetical protein SPLC1_S230510 [Arthrospira platensis C1]|nr:hypothetical protein SPLC1_S230510 [Arthrospira platensis C1]
MGGLAIPNTRRLSQLAQGIERSVYLCLGVVEVQIGVKGLNAIAFLS